jgi:hypothetical protein
MSSHNPAAFMLFTVIDQHTVAAEFFADLRAGGINGTGKSIP